MKTHVKEVLATITVFLSLVGVIHAGIWFTLFGIPDVTVLGFPFHYFWLVAGGPTAMFILYSVYYRYITTAIRGEKDQLKATAGDANRVLSKEIQVEPGDSDD